MKKAVWIAQSVQWLGQRLCIRGIVVRFLGRARVFSIFQNTQTRSGAHPTCYPVDTRIPFSITQWLRSLTPNQCRSYEWLAPYLQSLYAFMAYWRTSIDGEKKVQLRVRVDLRNAEKARGAHRTGGRADVTAGVEVKRKTPVYDGDQTPTSRSMC